MKLNQYEIERAYEEGLEDSGRREEFCKDREADFFDYVWEHFKDIVKEFESNLHPNVLLDDDVDTQDDLFGMYLWHVLDGRKLAILCRSFCESNWEEYKDFVSEFVNQLDEF